jgi:hypothetical protein
MITREKAERVVYERINAPDPNWPDKPEMIVVRVDEHELGWVVFYTSRPYHETGDFRFAIAGNAPYLVSREDGALFETGTAPPFEARLRAAELKLRAHLVGKEQS